MGSLAVVGSANMDLVARAAEFPRPGETVIGSGFATFPGGKGANQAIAAGRFAWQPEPVAKVETPEDVLSIDELAELSPPRESTVKFIGQLGDDDFGIALRAGMAPWVDTIYLGTDPIEPTGVAIILLDDAGQNQITVVPGANGTLHNGYVHASLQEIKPSVVLASLEIPLDAVTIAALAIPEESTFILNPAPAKMLSTALLERTDIITPNETEAEILTGIAPVDAASRSACAAALRTLGPAIAIITLGASGVLVQTENEEFTVSAPTVDVVDTTGAGDCFNGILAAALAEGYELRQAVELGVRGASLSVQRNGAQASMPTRQEILEI